MLRCLYDFILTIKVFTYIFTYMSNIFLLHQYKLLSNVIIHVMVNLVISYYIYLIRYLNYGPTHYCRVFYIHYIFMHLSETKILSLQQICTCFNKQDIELPCLRYVFQLLIQVTRKWVRSRHVLYYLV